MGAPSKLTPALLAKLEAIADDGFEVLEVCTKLKIGKSTFYRWAAGTSNDPLRVGFRDAAARVREGSGRQSADEASQTLRELMKDPEVRASDRIAAAKALLQIGAVNRVELTGRDGGPVEVSTDARARLEELLKRSAPSEE